MGLFNFRNARKDKENTSNVLKMVTENGNGFYSWNGKMYQSDIIRACIKPQTKAIGKMVAKHIRETETPEGIKLEINPQVFIRFLLEEPNEYMTFQVMMEKVANQLALNSNAFILILRDQMGLPCGLYPIPATTVQTSYDAAGRLTLCFTFDNGKRANFLYSDVIHIRDDFMENDIFGTSPIDTLREVMNVVTTVDQGLVNAIKNSGTIKWLLKFSSALRDDDLTMKAQEFARNYLSFDSSGVAATDSKVDASRIEPKDYVPNNEITKAMVDRIYSFFGTNESIVTSNYTEDQWIAYYEQRIEPFAKQFADEFTRKLFTRRERGCGNEIIFESSALTFASLSTKLNLVQFVDRGIMTPNEVRAYLNLAPIEGGDIALLRKDTGTLTEGGSE